MVLGLAMLNLASYGVPKDIKNLDSRERVRTLFDLGFRVHGTTLTFPDSDSMEVGQFVYFHGTSINLKILLGVQVYGPKVLDPKTVFKVRDPKIPWWDPSNMVLLSRNSWLCSPFTEERKQYPTRSKSNDAIRRMYDLGYRVTETGDIVLPDGSFRDGSFRSTISKSGTVNWLRFAAFCFFGESVLAYPKVVRARNGVRSDLRKANIELGYRGKYGSISSHNGPKLNPEIYTSIYLEYLQGNVTTNELASRYGVAQPTITHVIRRKGIYQGVDPRITQEVRRLYESGSSIAEVATTLGLRKDSVRARLKILGILRKTEVVTLPKT